jgi:hypothetical protein
MFSAVAIGARAEERDEECLLFVSTCGRVRNPLSLVIRLAVLVAIGVGLSEAVGFIRGRN